MTAIILFVSLICAFQVGNALDSYRIWCQGNCDRDATPSDTVPGLVLMGGGVSNIYLV